ncbi:azurin [Sphingobacterium puteale]|jgi:azurin|uniref:Azurin n=3 Tax=Sphingobacterium TaxID=28453 RepID=A0A363NNJ9_9SPHI|nr:MULTISPECIES: plastocyanin/azurin family copper-binding protein [Sphingobacterium]MDR2270832.1 cupredoxin domain-containing protein [Sphingobacterium sp.]PUV22290.1 azurin [Sphingobacterium athyrii]QIH32162.1 azurin [Sphingobacterium sp. DR205]RKO69502.1 azurin [Sphingobacterium puteale]
MKKLFMIPAVAVALSIASCGGNSEKSGKSASTESTTSTENQATETVPGIENVAISNSLSLEGNDQMKFDKDLFRVKAGEPVELSFKNAGTMPKESMGHNVVILKPGVDLPTFGAEAAAAAADEYIPKSALSSIVSHTKLLGPGETDKITFTLEKGVYPFICSFPGHYGVMQGKIVAE